MRRNQIAKRACPSMKGGRNALLGMGLFGTILSISILGVLGIFATIQLTGTKKDTYLDLAVQEAISIKTDAEKFSTKATANGYGYVYSKTGVPMNAELLQVYTASRFDVVGVGANSYFCSKTPYGCDLKYYFSTGLTDSTWSMFIDASAAISSMELNEKTRFEDEIEKSFSQLGTTPVVNHGATVVSAASTDVGASVASSGDGVFELGQLRI